MLVLTAKAVGTAVVAHLFALTRPALMRLHWFARGYARWVAWKAELLDWARASAAWQQAARWRARVADAWLRWRARAAAGRRPRD